MGNVTLGAASCLYRFEIAGAHEDKITDTYIAKSRHPKN